MQSSKSLFIEACAAGLNRLGLTGSAVHANRLAEEAREILGKKEVDYFLNLKTECEQNRTYYNNDHNSLVPYILGICQEFDINNPPKYDYGEYPDIDIDYIDGVREYLKEDYAKKEFGEEYVCNIASYNTYGTKSALKDMARVFSLPHEDVDAVTRNLKDKDKDGKPLKWDDAVDLHEEFQDYCKLNPEVADAAKRLVGRIRGSGQHASGLVVSRVPISDHIPLIRGKEGSMAAAWPEGQGASDLSTVGFIKFDFLGLDGNQKIATTCKLSCEEKIYRKQAINANKIVNAAIGENTVCAVPGGPSWSDTNYLDDPKCLEMANRGDLRLVFQFDGSPGIRNLAREGGVTSFDDLVAYTSLFRPGPMKLGAHKQYCKRKQGEETWEVHPMLKEGPANLTATYGILAYQEQIARVLNTVGLIPLKDCETVRKAISKKKVEKFQKYKDMFIENGQTTIGATVKELEYLWELISAFSGYGFNQAHAVGYCYISSRMLWLKVHQPLTFYTSMFTHTKVSKPQDYEKIQEYKREANKQSVKVEKVSLNNSKNDFSIKDGKIYWGFCKVKGIGEDAGKRIESMQPFSGIEDFLKRYGTDAKVVQPLIALKCFTDTDQETALLYYQCYKEFERKERSRIKRYETTIKKLQAEIEAAEEIKRPKLIKKLETTVANKLKKDEFVEIPTLEGFDRNFSRKVGKADDRVDLAKIIRDPSGEKAEMAFLGFVWEHPIDKIPGYQGQLIDSFLDSGDKDGHVEVLIKKVEKTQGPKTTYYKVDVEDGAYKKKKMMVWENEWKRFGELIKVGAFLRIHVEAPTKFPTLGIYQPPGSRWNPPKRETDYRVVSIN